MRPEDAAAEAAALIAQPAEPAEVAKPAKAQPPKEGKTKEPKKKQQKAKKVKEETVSLRWSLAFLQFSRKLLPFRAMPFSSTASSTRARPRQL